MSVEARFAYLQSFAEIVKKNRDALAAAISAEAGKPRWEALTEVDAVIGKVALTKQALTERRSDQSAEKDGLVSATRYKPHGVLGVLGPFNFPVHLPNGHIVPALLAGNTVVYKPSEMTPGVAEKYMQMWDAVKLPAGVINMIQGGRAVGAALAGHAGIDGLLFTGSRAAGETLSRMLAADLGKILALELGGNNPLVVSDVHDVDAAVYWIIQSAFITAGQRCTCARRLIVPRGIGGEEDRVIARLAEAAAKIVVGPPTMSPEPFMGPVISEAAAKRVLAAQEGLLKRGGVAILPMRSLGGAFLSPGIVDVTAISEREDEEIFGPLLQVIRVDDFAAAVAEANRTRYGLSAGLLSDDRALYEKFFREIRAGVVSWNRPTTGASGALPFGGVGTSGNHRPSGFFAIDYCSFPVAALEAGGLALPKTLSPGITL